MRRTLVTGSAASILVLGALLPQAGWASEAEGCHPTQANRPVCPDAAALDVATFLDPTATVVGAEHITLADRIYVGPFAELIATEDAPITIGPETNVQDNVLILGSRDAEDDDDGHDGEGGSRGDGDHHGDGDHLAGPQAAPGVEIAERVIMAHGASVIGPAQVGIGGGDIDVDPDDDQEVFLSFGSQVDGAILEKNTGISALGRVGPGVVLHSGFIVLPGKNVTTQAQADNPALGKVRLLTEADIAFNEAVLEVNIAFAREYTRLYRDDPDNVHGINVDPGGTSFNPDRDLPSFAGREVAEPGFRNRIIGDVDLADSLADFSAASGDRISLRADEGEPFVVGHVEEMDDDVIFHALEEAELEVGDNVSYGEGVIVHGGGRVTVEGQPDEPTAVGDDVVLKDGAVVFRSTIGDGAVIGERSAVVGTTLAPGTVVPPYTIILNDAFFGAVEW